MGSGVRPAGEEGGPAIPCEGRGQGAPSAHRRLGYPLSGCVPAEPDSVSPGAVIVPRRPTSFQAPLDTVAMPQKSIPFAGNARGARFSRMNQFCSLLRASCQDFAGVHASDQGDEAPPPGPPTLFSVVPVFAERLPFCLSGQRRCLVEISSRGGMKTRRCSCIIAELRQTARQRRTPCKSSSISIAT